MTDPTTASDAPPSTLRRGRRRGSVVEPLVVLAVFAGAGAAGGWWWERWWSPVSGVAVDGEWVPGFRPDDGGFVYDFQSLEGLFAGTAQFVVIGVLAGLVLGVLCALLGRRSELVMLAAVAVGSVLATLVAYRLGTHLGPADPAVLAAGADDGTSLPSALTLSGLSPFLSWPLGALVGLMLTYFLLPDAERARATRQDDERWLQRPDWLDEGSTGTRSGTSPS